MADDADLTTSLQKLAFKAVDNLYVPGQNLVYSPASLGFALGMVLEGTDGESRKEILDLMVNSEHNNDDQAVEKVSDFLTKLFRGDPNGVLNLLSIANLFYAEKSVVFNESFMAILKDKYKASVRCLDFINAQNEAVNTINDDAKSATGGKISKIVDRISHDTVSIIVNAIYFRGKWKDPFYKESTANQNFYLSNRQVIRVPMMIKEKFDIEINGPNEGNARILKLPYDLETHPSFKSEQLEQIYMVVAMPDSENIKHYLSTFDMSTLNQSLDAAYLECEATLWMPRFKIESTFKLIPTLQQLGVSQIFTDDANFKKLSKSRVKISDICQKAFIEVDEEGTVAAALTEVYLTLGATLHDSHPYFFRVDKPFVYLLISEDQNRQRQILFLGVVEDPLQNC